MNHLGESCPGSLPGTFLYCASLAILASGCASGCESDVYPLGSIALTSPSGTSAHVVDNNHTFALPHRDLSPPSADSPGSTHTLSFTHPSGETPRQEVIGFDLDYSEPILAGPQPTTDYVPAHVAFVSVPAGTSSTYTFDSAPTAHVIRYWHGRCAATTPWGAIFDPLSDGVFKGIVDGAKENPLVTSIERNYDVFQPHFIGAYATIAHGFSFEASYNFNSGYFSFTYYMNPAYELHIRPEDGLLTVVSVHQGVVPSQPALQDALANTVPEQLARTINEGLTFSLRNPAIPTPCDPNASVSAQQERCFSEGIGTVDDPGYLFTIFELGFKSAGFDGDTAQWAAKEMMEGLEAKNFSCVASDGVNSCAIHPVVERINVLPDELEFVFVAEDDPYQKVFFYQNLPTVVEALLPGTTVPQFCYQPFSRLEGEVAMITHGYLVEDL